MVGAVAAERGGRDGWLVAVPLWWVGRSGRAYNNGRANSGSAYVLFGPVADGTVDLADLDAAGVRIDGVVVGAHVATRPVAYAAC